MKHVGIQLHIQQNDELVAGQGSSYVTLKLCETTDVTMFFDNIAHAKRMLDHAITALTALEETKVKPTECQRFGDLGGYCPGDDMPPCPPCKVAAELASGE